MKKPIFSFAAKKLPKPGNLLAFGSLLLLALVGLLSLDGSFFPQSQAAGTTYYVDAASGVDSNSGIDTSHPWKTIAKVNSSIFSPGDSILFKRGQTWREQLNFSSSGSAGSPITFGSYGSGANPVISGSDLITARWTRDSANIWKAAVTTQPNIVYFNNAPGAQTAAKTDITSEFKWFWASNILYVWSPSDSDPGAYYTNPGIEAGARSQVIRTNDRSYVTVDGITARDGNDITAALINVGSVAVTGVVFQNCVIERGAGSGIVLKGSTTAHDVTIKNCMIQNNRGWGIAINNQYTASSQISDNIITGNGFNSITNNQEYSQIDGVLGNFNIFKNTIYATTPNGCKNGGLVGDYCHGIYYAAGFGGNLTIPANIYQNTIYSNLYGSGIKVVGSANIYQNKTYSNKAAGILVGQNGAVNVVYAVYSNLVYANNTGDASDGIVEQTKGTGAISLSIYNNTLYHNANTSQLELKIADAPEVLTVKNNIFVTTDTRRTMGLYAAQTGTVNIDYNLHWRADGNPNLYANGDKTWAQWQALGYDTHGVDSKPLLTNAGSNDFTLQSASPAIDAGTNTGLTADYAGTSVPQCAGYDIGAFEYLSATPTPTSTPTPTPTPTPVPDTQPPTVPTQGCSMLLVH